MFSLGDTFFKTILIKSRNTCSGQGWTLPRHCALAEDS